MSKTNETIMYVVAKYNHTSKESGFTNENISGSSGSSSLNSILIPNDIKGTEKSTAAFLSDVIVKSHIPKPAFCK